VEFSPLRKVEHFTVYDCPFPATGLDRMTLGGDTTDLMRILTRYVLIELSKVFLLSLGAMTLMMIIVGVAREALQQSLPPAQVFCLIPYILPDALRVAVPVTMLLATTTVFGRMSGLNEFVATKAMGISPLTLVWPLLAVSVFLSFVTVWLNDIAVSWGRSGAQRVVIEAVEEIAYGMLRTQRRYSSQRFAINVKRVDGRRLIRPTLSLKEHGSVPSITITAKEAELRSDRKENVLKIILYDGKIDVKGQVTVRFPDTYEQEIPLRDASRANRPSQLPSWLSLSVISEQIAKQKEAIRRAQEKDAVRAAYQMLCGDFDVLTGEEWKKIERQMTSRWERLYRLRTEPHRRWSAGFSCICFAWVGAPMAIWLRNRDLLTSFFLCFMPILIVFYPLMIYGIDGAKGGTIPPASVWAGNLVLILWGVYLFRKVIRY